MSASSKDPFEAWLRKHLDDAQKEYARAQEAEESGGDDEMYEQVHQMWGYLAGLEKCLKEFKVRRPAPSSRKGGPER